MSPRARFTTKILKDLSSSTFQDLKRRVGADKRVVKIGIPSDKKHQPDGTSLARIAAAHEFGVPDLNIPERSFLRTGIRRIREQIIRLNRINLVRIVKGEMTVARALGLMGNMAAGAVKQEIRNGKFVPLKPKTIARKGSSKPLIDKGQMVQSVTYVVEGK
jgi:hypothetical protein